MNFFLPLKSSENDWFSDDFGGCRNSLMHLILREKFNYDPLFIYSVRIDADKSIAYKKV